MKHCKVHVHLTGGMYLFQVCFLLFLMCGTYFLFVLLFVCRFSFQALMERLTMHNPRSNVIMSGRSHSTSLKADIEAGEATILKYLSASYRRAVDECKKWKVLCFYTVIVEDWLYIYWKITIEVSIRTCLDIPSFSEMKVKAGMKCVCTKSQACHSKHRLVVAGPSP